MSLLSPRSSSLCCMVLNCLPHLFPYELRQRRTFSSLYCQEAQPPSSSLPSEDNPFSPLNSLPYLSTGIAVRCLTAMFNARRKYVATSDVIDTSNPVFDTSSALNIDDAPPPRLSYCPTLPSIPTRARVRPCTLSNNSSIRGTYPFSGNPFLMPETGLPSLLSSV